MTDIELISYLGPKIVIAIICGAIVGIERERKHKSAGIKTITLICLGAMIFTCINYLVDQNRDGRIISQIVTGIGFLGAGAIIRPTRATVAGMTTAAMIWIMASIGVLIGLGFIIVPVCLSLLIAIATTAISHIEKRLFPISDKQDPN